MLVSPAEPPALRALGEVSSVPETKGADFLLFTANGIVGVQRKRYDDLVASIHDGRYQKEMGQLSCADLHQAVVVIEGDFMWGVNGESLALKHARFKRASYHGIELSTQLLGVWVVRTDNLTDTAAWLAQAEAWFSKADHTSLATRPKKQRDAWGDARWHLFSSLLQCFDGISVKTARSIYDKAKADGINLLAWQVDEAWFKTVDGVGSKRAAVLAGAFGKGRG